MGDLGRLWLSIRSEGSDTLDEAKAHNIKRVTARFSPWKEFKQIWSHIGFVKAS